MLSQLSNPERLLVTLALAFALAAVLALLLGLGVVAHVRGRRPTSLERRILARTLERAGDDGREPLQGKGR